MFMYKKNFSIFSISIKEVSLQIFVSKIWKINYMLKQNPCYPFSGFMIYCLNFDKMRRCGSKFQYSSGVSISRIILHRFVKVFPGWVDSIDNGPNPRPVCQSVSAQYWHNEYWIIYHWTSNILQNSGFI